MRQESTLLAFGISFFKQDGREHERCFERSDGRTGDIVVLMRSVQTRLQRYRPGVTTGTDDASSPKVNCFHPLSVHPKVRLSNLEFSTGTLNREIMSVDGEVTSGEQEYPLTLVVVPADGQTHKMAGLQTVWQTEGALHVEFSSIGFGSPSGPRVASGCEVFLTIAEGEVTSDSYFFADPYETNGRRDPSPRGPGDVDCRA